MIQNKSIVVYTQILYMERVSSDLDNKWQDLKPIKQKIAKITSGPGLNYPEFGCHAFVHVIFILCAPVGLINISSIYTPTATLPRDYLVMTSTKEFRCCKQFDNLYTWQRTWRLSTVQMHTSQPFKMKKRDKIGENVGF